MNFIKKQGIGAYITLASVILGLVAMIIYGVTLATGNGVQVANGGEVFLGAEQFGGVTTLGIFGLLFLVAAMALSQLKFEGILGTVCDFVSGALRILAPVFFMLVLLNFLNLTLTGLGWTFFSNEELEINPVAKTAGMQTIVALIFFAITTVASIAAAFFGMVKTEQD